MKAIIYARFSPRPNAAECDSIEKQIERCTAYCNACGYEIAATLNDADASGGRADNRPGLQTAIELACKEHAVLVCYDLSRLARSTKDAIEIADRLQRCGANLAFLDMRVDTSSPTGRCFFTIIAAFAQLYRDQISERTSKAMLKYQSEGRLMSSRPPYGMKVIGRALVPDLEEQKNINKIKQLCHEGYCVAEIANQLNARGHRCRGGQWYPMTVKRILQRVS